MKRRFDKTVLFNDTAARGAFYNVYYSVFRPSFITHWKEKKINKKSQKGYGRVYIAAPMIALAKLHS